MITRFRQIIGKPLFLILESREVMSMLYAEICPKVRRHNARPEGGSALCFLTLGHISAYNMDNTILLLLLL
jgi:hypothetical protein